MGSYLSEEYGKVKQFADSSKSYVSACDGHRPRHVITGKDWDVFAGTRRRCEDLLNDYDVVLNLSGTSVSERHHIPLPGFERWERYGGKFTEVELDWPDYGIVALPLEFWKQLLAYLEERKARMLVFCVGGHGRTGTAVASMLVASGWDPEAAIKWVRGNYCRKAIESDSQENYIRALGGLPPRKPKAWHSWSKKEEALESPSAFERETRATHPKGTPWPRCANCDHSQKRHYGTGCHASSCDCTEFVPELADVVQPEPVSTEPVAEGEQPLPVVDGLGE